MQIQKKVTEMNININKIFGEKKDFFKEFLFFKNLERFHFIFKFIFIFFSFFFEDLLTPATFSSKVPRKVSAENSLRAELVVQKVPNCGQFGG